MLSPLEKELYLRDQTGEHKISIKYKVEGEGPYTCVPIELSPSHVSLKDYHVSFDSFNRQITQVTNYEEGAV